LPVDVLGWACYHGSAIISYIDTCGPYLTAPWFSSALFSLVLPRELTGNIAAIIIVLYLP
jgi:hypothetical protein